MIDPSRQHREAELVTMGLLRRILGPSEPAVDREISAEVATLRPDLQPYVIWQSLILSSLIIEELQNGAGLEQALAEVCGYTLEGVWWAEYEFPPLPNDRMAWTIPATHAVFLASGDTPERIAGDLPGDQA